MAVLYYCNISLTESVQVYFNEPMSLNALFLIRSQALRVCELFFTRGIAACKTGALSCNGAPQEKRIAGAFH